MEQRKYQMVIQSKFHLNLVFNLVVSCYGVSRKAFDAVQIIQSEQLEKLFTYIQQFVSALNVVEYGILLRTILAFNRSAT